MSNNHKHVEIDQKIVKDICTKIPPEKRAATFTSMANLFNEYAGICESCGGNIDLSYGLDALIWTDDGDDSVYSGNGRKLA